jgi:hypothetical protein
MAFGQVAISAIVDHEANNPFAANKDEHRKMIGHLYRVRTPP